MAKKPEVAEAPARATLAEIMAKAKTAYGTDDAMMPAMSAEFGGKRLSTGVFALDVALAGGWEEGKIHMPIGHESSGKTVLSLYLIREAQRKWPHMTPCFIDLERALNLQWAQKLGVDLGRLLISRPSSGEQACDVLEEMTSAADVSVIVMDSLPGLVPVKELSKSADEDVVALQARLIGRALRKAVLHISEERNGVRPIFFPINQWRSKIAMMGDTRQIPGGNAVRFFVSTIIEMAGKPVEGKTTGGISCFDHTDVSIKIRKNKCNNGSPSVEFRLDRNPDSPLCGLPDEIDTIIAVARQVGVIEGGGNSWGIGPVLDKRFKKIMDMAEFLLADTALLAEVKYQTLCLYRERMGLTGEGWQ
jgi:recombination protein RecA